MFTYDTYEVGKAYGTDTFTIDDQIIEKWRAAFPDDDCGDLMPPGIITLIQQQAYKRIITPRPPGHVQGGQTFQIYSLPRIGSSIETSVSCLSKEIRKERKWTRMSFTSTDNTGRKVFTGVNTILVPY